MHLCSPARVAKAAELFLFVCAGRLLHWPQIGRVLPHLTLQGLKGYSSATVNCLISAFENHELPLWIHSAVGRPAGFINIELPTA